MARPRPPSITTEPFVGAVELVVSLNFASCARSDASVISCLVSSDNLKSLLNVTGPSNCDSICFDAPPSTKSLSLTTTSSAT